MVSYEFFEWCIFQRNTRVYIIIVNIALAMLPCFIWKGYVEMNSNVQKKLTKGFLSLRAMLEFRYIES